MLQRATKLPWIVSNSIFREYVVLYFDVTAQTNKKARRKNDRPW